MSPYLCPICGNPNPSTQQSCSKCEFPVANLDSALLGVKQQDVLKWAKTKYSKLEIAEKENADVESKFTALTESLKKLLNELPQHIIVDHADRQRLNDPKSHLLSKIDEWNMNMGEFSSNFYALITSDLLKFKPGITNSVHPIHNPQRMSEK